MNDHRGEPRVGDEEFLQIARDPAIARLLGKKLDALANGEGGETLSEMAKQVLSGRLGLRQAVEIGSYEQEIISHMNEAQRNVDQMSSEEKVRTEEEGRRILDECQREIDQERREKSDSQIPQTRKRHSAKGWSLY